MDITKKSDHWTQRLSQQAVLMATEFDRLKAKHVMACTAATTLEELAAAQRERIADLEGWLRDVSAAKSLAEAHRISHEALW